MTQQSIQDLFQKSKEQWLEDARHTAVKILANKRTVTIEEVLASCPRPQYLHPNATGSVFSSPEFTAVGYTNSRRSQSHGRTIRVWSLKQGFTPIKDSDYEYPESY